MTHPAFAWLRAARRGGLLATAGLALALAGRADRYVAQNGQAPAGGFTTWETAASNIQDAVAAAAVNDVVWVGAGRYTVPPNATNYVGSNVVFINRPLTLRSSNGVPGEAVIDGGGINRGVAVVYLGGTTNPFVLDGLVISNCYATNMGGGLLFNANSLGTWTGKVQHCRITDNTVAWGGNSGNTADPLRGSSGSRGGGLGAYSFTVSLNLTLDDCVLAGNSALAGPLTANKSSGGGLAHAGQGLLAMRACRVERNAADSGGGLHVYFTSIQADACRFSGNTASNASGGGYDNGAGLLLSSPGRAESPWLRNCLIVHNAAPGIGGGLTFRGAYKPLEIVNCTIVSNKAVGAGGGLYAKQNTADTGPGFTACNTLVYSNSPDNYACGSAYTETNVWFTNCCITPTNTVGARVFGPGNLTNNPQLRDWALPDYRLHPDSPCVNRGTNQDWMHAATDFEGGPRLRYGTVDIGAYEVLFRGTQFRSF